MNVGLGMRIGSCRLKLGHVCFHSKHRCPVSSFDHQAKGCVIISWHYSAFCVHAVANEIREDGTTALVEAFKQMKELEELNLEREFR